MMKSNLRIGAFKTKLLIALSGVLLILCDPVQASVISFQNQPAFNTATSGWTTATTDFESATAGNPYLAGPGFTLSLSGPDAPFNTPTVGNQFWTTSGTNYLGLDNSDTAFEAGDSLTFNFTTPVQAFGLYVIGGSDVGAGDITLVSGANTVSNGATADLTDGNGSYAYFLGFVSADSSTFTSVTLNDLTPDSARLLAVDVDDVVLGSNSGSSPVPEPGSIALMLIGLLALTYDFRCRVQSKPGKKR
jgi:hypothetical protein